MRILAIADLHLDLWQLTRRDPLAALSKVFPTLDALIIAGDLANNPIQNWPRAFELIGRYINPSKVYIIPGNHDYYGHYLAGDNNLRALAEHAGMNFAQKTVLELGGVRFLCCTLWTDFDLHGDPHHSMRVAQRAMSDYFEIARSDQDCSHILPDDTLAKHQEHLAWLSRELRSPFDGPTIVATHHCPSITALVPEHRLAPAYGSNLDRLISISSVDVWLFGHTHLRLHGIAHGTSVLNVSLGYPREVTDNEITEVMCRGLIDTDVPGLLVNFVAGR